MAEEKQKSFLEELQSLNEPTKRKVLIVATVVIMAVILYLWLGYFNGLVGSVSSSASAVADQIGQNQSQPAYQSAESGGGISVSGIFDFLKNAAATVFNYLDEAAHWLANLIDGSGQYNILPSK